MNKGIVIFIVVLVIIVFQFTRKRIKQTNFEKTLHNYFMKMGLQSEGRLFRIQADGHIRNRAIQIKGYRGVKYKKTRVTGLTIQQITIRLYTFDKYYLRLKPRSLWEKTVKKARHWTDDPDFNSRFTLSSSPAQFARAVFGPRPMLRKGLRRSLSLTYGANIPAKWALMDWFILEVKSNQIVLTGHYKRGPSIYSAKQLDEILRVLFYLADAVEEAAAYFPQFKAEPIPDSALN